MPRRKASSTLGLGPLVRPLAQDLGQSPNEGIASPHIRRRSRSKGVAKTLLDKFLPRQTLCWRGNQATCIAN